MCLKNYPWTNTTTNNDINKDINNIIIRTLE